MPRPPHHGSFWRHLFRAACYLWSMWDFNVCLPVYSVPWLRATTGAERAGLAIRNLAQTFRPYGLKVAHNSFLRTVQSRVGSRCRGSNTDTTGLDQSREVRGNVAPHGNNQTKIASMEYHGSINCAFCTGCGTWLLHRVWSRCIVLSVE